MLVRKISPICSFVLAIMIAMDFAIFAGAQDLGSTPNGANQHWNVIEETCSKLSPELRHVADQQAVRVIVQTKSSQQQLYTKLKTGGGHLKHALPLINGYVAEVSGAALKGLAL